MNLRNVTIGLSCIVLIAIICLLGDIFSWNGKTTVLATVFCGFPWVVLMILSCTCSKNSISQIFLSAISLLFGWMSIYELYNAFYINPDAQSGLVILALGVAGIIIVLIVLPLLVFGRILDSFLAKRFSFHTENPVDAVQRKSQSSGCGSD